MIEQEKRKPKRWKVIVGWVLLIWGFLGFGVNMLVWLPSREDLVLMIPSTIVSLLFIYGGWKLINKKEVRNEGNRRNTGSTG